MRNIIVIALGDQFSGICFEELPTSSAAEQARRVINEPLEPITKEIAILPLFDKPLAIPPPVESVLALLKDRAVSPRFLVFSAFVIVSGFLLWRYRYRLQSYYNIVRRGLGLRKECKVICYLFEPPEDGRLDPVCRATFQKRLQYELLRCPGTPTLLLYTVTGAAEPPLLSPRSPLLIPCLNSSRIGADVQLTMRRFRESRLGRVENPKILTIFHHQLNIREQKLTATSERLSSDEYFPGVQGVYDFRYWLDSGVYEHDDNRRNMGAIARFNWDTPVSDIMGPDWFLSDDLRTHSATIRDILSHKIGLSTLGGIFIMGLEPQYSRQEYCSRLHQLEERSAFRTQYIYNNFMFLLSACIAEKIGGKTYEELVWEKIFTPLDMTSPGPVFTSQLQQADIVKSYVIDNNGSYYPLDVEIVRTVIPCESSGGICASALDMAKWLQMQVDEGTSGDTVIIDYDYWSETHYPQFVIPQPNIQMRPPHYPVEIVANDYGLAWEVGSYREYHHSAHSGSVSSFSSFASIFRDLNLGIFTAVSGPGNEPGNYFNRVLHFFIVDTIMEFEPWLNDTTSCTFPDPWRPAVTSPRGKRASEEVETSKRIPKLEKSFTIKKTIENQSEDSKLVDEKTEKAGLSIEDESLLVNTSSTLAPPTFDGPYVGVYGHLLLGNATITINEDPETMPEFLLRYTLGRVGTGLLRQSTDAIFLAEFDGLLWYFSNTGPYQDVPNPMRFSDMGEDGYYQNIVAPSLDPSNPPVFKRGLKWNP